MQYPAEKEEETRGGHCGCFEEVRQLFAVYLHYLDISLGGSNEADQSKKCKGTGTTVIYQLYQA
jgi:hypothetical protein